MSILHKQAIGFCSLIILSWITEAVGVPHLLFGEPLTFSWPRVLFRTALILIVWAIVHATTRRLLRRLHELEEFLLICSWCRKVGHKDEWLTLEQFFDQKFQTGTSHGICPECANKQLAEHRAGAAPRVEAVRRDATARN